jgi:choline dehydrogenase
VSVSRPQSRGSVEISSADPAAPLRSALELLGDASDRQRLVAALRLIRRIHRMAALQRHARAVEDIPDIAALDGSDAALLEYAAENCGGQYHPVGTCRMGSDVFAVVDPTLQVSGIANLYVADASVMPSITSANTNAPVLMIGERAAEFIRTAT